VVHRRPRPAFSGPSGGVMELPGPAPRVARHHKGPNYTNVCFSKTFPIPALKGGTFDYL